MQFIPLRSKRVRSYLDIAIKFHDYSSFITAFDVATNNSVRMNKFYFATEHIV